MAPSVHYFVPLSPDRCANTVLAPSFFVRQRKNVSYARERGRAHPGRSEDVEAGENEGRSTGERFPRNFRDGECVTESNCCYCCSHRCC